MNFLLRRNPSLFFYIYFTQAIYMAAYADVGLHQDCSVQILRYKLLALVELVS